jgi:hypothetical protein
MGKSNELFYISGTIFPKAPQVQFVKEIEPIKVNAPGRNASGYRIKRCGLFKCLKNLENCSKTFETAISNVKSGNCQSCGCYRNARVIETLSKDFTGQRSGKLTAKKRMAKYKNGETWYLCNCDCGIEKPIPSEYFWNLQSCGECQRESLWNRKNIKEVESVLNKNGENLNGWYYKNAELWLKITCPDGHKYPKDMTWDNYNHGNRCAVCASMYYKTERFVIEKLVKPIDKTVKAQYKIIHKNGSKQYLDAAIESIRVAVEYQGEQHYKTVGWDKGDTSKLKKRQARDLKKRKWCKDNEWILIVIPCNRFNTDEQKEYWKNDIEATIKYRQALLDCGRLKFKTELPNQ